MGHKVEHPIRPKPHLWFLERKDNVGPEHNQRQACSKNDNVANQLQNLPAHGLSIAAASLQTQQHFVVDAAGGFFLRLAKRWANSGWAGHAATPWTLFSSPILTRTDRGMWLQHLRKRFVCGQSVCAIS
jgi:hypothetical protein